MSNPKIVTTKSLPDVSGSKKSYLSVNESKQGNLNAKPKLQSKSKDSIGSGRSGKSERSGHSGQSGSSRRQSENFPPPIMDSENTVTDLQRYESSQICNRRGCWISMMILAVTFLLSGVVTLAVWLNLVLTEEIVWKEEFVPPWIFFDNRYYLGIVPAQPLFCSIWLLLILLFSVFSKRKGCYRTLRLYYVVAPYTILPCCGFFLFYLFFLGWLEKALVNDHLENTMKQYSYDEYHERMWDIMQIKLSCCGLHDGHWAQWLGIYHEDVTNIKGFKIPRSCCYKQGEGTNCPKSDVAKHVFQEGCVDALYKYYRDIGKQVTIVIAINTILTGLTILFATRYYSLWRSVDEKEPHYYNMKVYTREVFCMCCCVKRNAVGVTVENEKEPSEKGDSRTKLPVVANKKSK